MEKLAVYNDQNEVIPNEFIERSRKLEEHPSKYFKIVLAFIKNKDDKYLIQKTSIEKDNIYATTGGHVQYGISSLQTVHDEVFEELGVELSLDEFTLFDTTKFTYGYRDSYYVEKDIDINDIKLQVEEVESVAWMSVSEIESLIKENKFRKGNIEPFQKLLRKNR